jgi:hypothetical protein
MKDFLLNENFLDEAENFTEKKFTQRFALSELIRIINKTNQFEKFNELVFNAKYVNGLYRSIKLSQTNTQISNIDQIKKDFFDNLEKVSLLIKQIFNIESNETTIEISKKYTEIGEVQFQNLLLLIDDLDQIKKYLNYLKRNF